MLLEHTHARIKKSKLSVALTFKTWSKHLPWKKRDKHSKNIYRQHINIAWVDKDKKMLQHIKCHAFPWNALRDNKLCVFEFMTIPVDSRDVFNLLTNSYVVKGGRNVRRIVNGSEMELKMLFNTRKKWYENHL